MLKIFPKAWFATVLLCFFLLPADVFATIYTFTDETGVIHFTNVPNDSRYRPLHRKDLVKSPSRQPKSLDSLIQQAGRHYDVDPYLITAVIKAESDFDRHAVSKKGAKGLMQLMPDTIKDMGVNDPFNAKDNINGGTRYLKWLIKTFKGDLQLVLAAYNAGPGRVKKLGRIPRIPETLAYVDKVLDHYEDLKNRSAQIFR